MANRFWIIILKKINFSNSNKAKIAKSSKTKVLCLLEICLMVQEVINSVNNLMECNNKCVSCKWCTSCSNNKWWCKCNLSSKVWEWVWEWEWVLCHNNKDIWEQEALEELDKDLSIIRTKDHLIIQKVVKDKDPVIKIVPKSNTNRNSPKIM